MKPLISLTESWRWTTNYMVHSTFSLRYLDRKHYSNVRISSLTRYFVLSARRRRCIGAIGSCWKSSALWQLRSKFLVPVLEQQKVFVAFDKFVSTFATFWSIQKHDGNDNVASIAGELNMHTSVPDGSCCRTRALWPFCDLWRRVYAIMQVACNHIVCDKRANIDRMKLRRSRRPSMTVNPVTFARVNSYTLRSIQPDELMKFPFSVTKEHYDALYFLTVRHQLTQKILFSQETENWMYQNYNRKSFNWMTIEQQPLARRFEIILGKTTCIDTADWAVYLFYIDYRKAITGKDSSNLLHPRHAEYGFKKREIRSTVDWSVRIKCGTIG